MYNRLDTTEKNATIEGVERWKKAGSEIKGSGNKGGNMRVGEGGNESEKLYELYFNFERLRLRE